MLSTQQNSTYRAFYDSARQNKILEPKTTFLIHLATAMAAGCTP
jgi:hypothetical protein